MDTERMIEFVKETMISSGKNSKWWNDHLKEQMVAILGKDVEKNVMDSIYSSIKVFINSGTFNSVQYYYNLDDINEKKEVFSSCNLSEKKEILSIIDVNEKKMLLNDNKDIELKDIIELIKSSDISDKEKREIVSGVLDDDKLKTIKSQYPSLDGQLKEYLGAKYNTIFDDKRMDNANSTFKNNSEPVNQVIDSNALVMQYNNSINKIMYFDSLKIDEKKALFDKLDINGRRLIVNNTKDLNMLINNYKNKNSIFSIMDREVMTKLYNSSSNEIKNSISGYLTNKEEGLKKAEDKLSGIISGIKDDNDRIFDDNVNRTKIIVNYLGDRKSVEFNLNTEKMYLGVLEEREVKLEEKISKLMAKTDNGKLSTLSKRQYAKYKMYSDELKKVNKGIKETNADINKYTGEIDKINRKIEEERKAKKENTEKSVLNKKTMNQSSSKKDEVSNKISDVSSYHRELVGEDNTLDSSMVSNVSSVADDDNTRSDTSRNMDGVMNELTDKGINMSVPAVVNSEQNFKVLSMDEINKMTPIEAEKAVLFFQAEAAKNNALAAEKMAELIELHNGRSRTLKKAGFSNVVLFLISLIVIVAVGFIIFFVLR